MLLLNQVSATTPDMMVRIGSRRAFVRTWINCAGITVAPVVGRLNCLDVAI
jgi:hypothetical protein